MNRIGTFLAAGGIVFLAGEALAADANSHRFEVFGEFGAGVRVGFDNGSNLEGITDADDALEDIDGEAIVIPAAMIDGKIATYKPDSGFGVQFDAAFRGFDINWVEPFVDLGNEGYYYRLMGTGHVSYSPNDQVKLGLFGSYRANKLHVAEPGGDSFVDIEYDAAAYGIEGIWLPADHVTLFGRLAVYDILGGSLSYDIDGDADSGTFEDSDNLISGYHVGGGVRIRKGDYWTFGGDVNFTSGDFDTLLTLSTFEIEGSAAYMIPDTNWSAIGSVAFIRQDLDYDGDEGFFEGYNATLRFVRSFGTQPNSAARTLFVNHRD